MELDKSQLKLQSLPNTPTCFWYDILRIKNFHCHNNNRDAFRPYYHNVPNGFRYYKKHLRTKSIFIS